MGIPFEDARAIILDRVEPLEIIEVPLLQAIGRAIAEPLIADFDLPRFDNSAMDGYAVRAADCSPGTRLPVVGCVAAGSREPLTVQAGTAAKIMTGAPLPESADAVVPFEDVELCEDGIVIQKGVETGHHIRFCGEDIRRGETVIPEGTVLGAPEISFLAAYDRPLVKVRRPVRVAILSNGDELVELGKGLREGTIVNSNSWALAALVTQLGGEALQLGIARDNRESLLEKLARLAELRPDVLITSAGVSGGDFDLVRSVLAELGMEQVFWKVDIKPGHPTAFGMMRGMPVFSLPGNPVSTMITFEQFVRPALLKMMGHRRFLRPLLWATLQAPARKKRGRVLFMRVTVKGGEHGMVVGSSGDQNTGIQRTLLHANAIAILPADREAFSAGEKVQVQLLDALSI